MHLNEKYIKANGHFILFQARVLTFDDWEMWIFTLLKTNQQHWAQSLWNMQLAKATV